MHKNENARRKEITKIDNDHETGGGFVPKEFKSSRSKKHNAPGEKMSTEQMHENAIFGIGSGVVPMPINKTLDKNAQAIVDINKTASTERIIMNDIVSRKYFICFKLSLSSFYFNLKIILSIIFFNTILFF